MAGPFKLKSGNKTSFKEMGSSPLEHDMIRKRKYRDGKLIKEKFIKHTHDENYPDPDKTKEKKDPVIPKKELEEKKKAPPSTEVPKKETPKKKAPPEKKKPAPPEKKKPITPPKPPKKKKPAPPKEEKPAPPKPPKKKEPKTWLGLPDIKVTETIDKWMPKW